jgi:hypothetical protein
MGRRRSCSGGILGQRGRGLIALAALALAAAACSSSPSATPPTTTTTSTTPAAAATTTTAPVATTSPTAVQNLTVSDSVRTSLTASYVAFRHISTSDVAGTAPGSVYYAYDPTTKTYWALATFTPSSTASQQTLVGFQDGGSIGMFTMPAGASWSVSQAGEPSICLEAKYFPAPVLAVWNISTNLPPACG